MTRNCLNPKCNKEFTPKNKKGVYCSPNCRAAHAYLVNNATIYDQTGKVVKKSKQKYPKGISPLTAIVGWQIDWGIVDKTKVKEFQENNPIEWEKKSMKVIYPDSPDFKIRKTPKVEEQLSVTITDNRPEMPSGLSLGEQIQWKIDNGY